MWPDTWRLRVIVDHPMDTGLTDGIGIFIVETLTVAGPKGAAGIARTGRRGPAFILFFAPGQLNHDVRVMGRNNNGSEIDATIPLPLTQ